MCMHTQHQSRAGQLQQHRAVSLPVAQFEHRRKPLLYQRTVQNHFGIKLYRTTFLHAVVDVLEVAAAVKFH